MGIRSPESRSTRHPRSPRTLRRNPLQTRRRPPANAAPLSIRRRRKNRHRQTMDELDHPRRRNRHPPARARKRQHHRPIKRGLSSTRHQPPIHKFPTPRPPPPPPLSSAPLPPPP